MERTRRTVRFAVCIFIIFAMCKVAFGAEAMYERNSRAEISGWSIYVHDNDIDTSAELVTELDTTFAQCPSERTLEFISEIMDDSYQTLTVTGVDNRGLWFTEDVSLNNWNAALGATACTTNTIVRYVDQVTRDATGGTTTIRHNNGSDLFVTSIPKNSLEAGMAQHFNGDKYSYITNWTTINKHNAGDPIREITFDLRWYPDDEGCLYPTIIGYSTLDRVRMDTSGTLQRVFPQPIKCKPGGWLAVYATSTVANTDVAVQVQGYDSQR